MDIRLCVVDDRKEDRDMLKEDLKHFFELRSSFNYSCDEYPDGESFLSSYRSNAYDLVFFDIQMPGISGIELANQLRDLDADILIVFTTTSREFAFDAFPIHPFDYLVKPFTQDRLNKVLSEMIRVLSQEEPFVQIRIPRDVIDVQLRSIVAVESHGHSVHVMLDDKRIIVSTMRFSEIEELLTSDARFLPCNRGVVINMDHVLSLDQDIFRMKDGSTYPLRVRERAKIVSKYTKYMLTRVSGGNR